jgi:hypothetical protein
LTENNLTENNLTENNLTENNLTEKRYSIKIGLKSPIKKTEIVGFIKNKSRI